MTDKGNVITITSQDEPALSIAQTQIKHMIHIIRGQQVMLDSDLALLYQVETKRLNERVKRNSARFRRISASS